MQPIDTCGAVDLYYLRALTGLTRLDLGYAVLTPGSPHHITVLRNLRELDLSGGDSDYGDKSWVDALKKLNVTVVRVGWNASGSQLLAAACNP